jgi:hypothetical protein
MARLQHASILALTLLSIGLSGQAFADKFAIANSTSPETSYDIAFDGTNFLVAIEAETFGAQLVSPSGELVGSLIAIGSTDGGSSGAGLLHVAFDGTNYLLVWTDDSIVGQFISPLGSTVGEPFEISTAVHDGSVKGIAYGGDQYVVVYSRSPSDSPNTTYYSRTVSGDGDVGSEVTLSSGFGDDSIRAIAFAGSNFLIVWVDGPGSSDANTEILGRLLSSSGTLGAEFSINASPASSNDISTVGTDGTNFLVVWADDEGDPNWELFGQLISPDGDLIGEVISVVENPGNQQVPFITFDGVNYLVTWTEL